MNRVHAQLPHAQAKLMMPAFLRGKLDSVLQRRMQEHIANCPPCAERHREDLELAGAIEQPPPGIELLLTSAARERNRAQLLRTIDEAGRDACPDSPRGVGQTRRGVPVPRTGALVAGMAAVLVVALMLPRAMAPDPADQPVTYQTRTSGDPGPVYDQGPTYRVVFEASATASSIQRLLLELGAVVVGGPTDAGVYTLAFPAGGSDDAQTLGLLRQQPEIVLAEKSVHVGG